MNLSAPRLPNGRQAYAAVGCLSGTRQPAVPVTCDRA